MLNNSTPLSSTPQPQTTDGQVRWGQSLVLVAEQVTTFGSNMGVPGLESCQPPKKNISRTASADNTISLIVGYQCLTKRTNVPKLFWVGRVSPTPF